MRRFLWILSEFCCRRTLKLVFIVKFFCFYIPIRYDDDDTERVGISHLLEHVIINEVCPTLPFRFGGATWPDRTEYSLQLQGSSEPLFKQLDSLSEVMFSSTSIENRENITSERKRVDGEFHIKRTQLGIRMFQIFMFKEISVPRFGCGNLETLKGNVDMLTSELTERLGLYRKCPVFVCIYSYLSLEDIQVIIVHRCSFPEFPHLLITGIVSEEFLDL